MEGADTSLSKSEIMEEMGFNKWEAERFLQSFGHRSEFGKHRTITQRELIFLRCEGVLAQWVKENCREGRRTVAERKGTG